MKKILFSFFLILLSTSFANAETINFSDALDTAIQNSYDLKISKLDIGIGEQQIRGVRADYFPKLNAYANAEYSRDLTGGQSQVNYIGNEVLLNNSRYQNSISLGMTYNVFDFGIKGRKLSIAKKDKFKRQAVYFQELRDLKINVVSSYTKALLSYKELKSKQQVLTSQKQLLEMKERLNVAGKISKTEVIGEAVKVAELEGSIEELKNSYSKALKELSYYTLKDYDPNTLDLKDFKQNEIVPVSNVYKLEASKIKPLDIEKTPEFKIYQAEIDKKQKELEIVKRQNLPQFNFATSYYLYGSDTNNLFSSYGDLSQRSLMFKLNTSMPVFDGFKNKSDTERVKLELEKLKLTKEQKLAELSKNYSQINDDAFFSKRQLANDEKTLQLVNQNISMIERLDQNKLIDKLTYLNQRIELLNKRFELEKTSINDYMASFKLDVMSNFPDQATK